MYNQIAVALLALAPLAQDPPGEVRPLEPRTPGEPSVGAPAEVEEAKPNPYASHQDRAEGLRTLSSRSAVAERELLYTVRPEERALEFITRERTTRREEMARIRADLEIREEELELLQQEHREIKADGRPGEAEEWLERNRNQVVRLIRVVASLREEVGAASGSQGQMDLAEQKLRALVDYKKSEARRYDREQATLSFSELGGIGPDLVPEVFGGASEEGMSPEVSAMFDDLFGLNFDLPSFRSDVARSIGWSFGAR